jgi:hypothetical protein
LIRTAAAAQSLVIRKWAAGGQVYGTEFPLPQRIIQWRLKPPGLLFIVDFEPLLDQFNSARNDVSFHHRALFQELLVFLLGTKTEILLGILISRPLKNILAVTWVRAQRCEEWSRESTRWPRRSPGFSVENANTRTKHAPR